MTAGIYNFTIEQGTYFERTFTWRRTNPDGSAGEPVDITAYTPKMQIRTKQGKLIRDLTSSLQKNGPAGTVTLSLSDTVTSALEFDTAHYDLKLAGDKPLRLIKGQVTIDPAETRDE